MATNPTDLALPSGAFQGPLTPPHENLQSFSPQTSPPPPTVHQKRDTDPYGQDARLQTGGEGAEPGQGEGLAGPRGFHSYSWQLNNMGDTTCQSSHWPHPVNCFGSVGNPETPVNTHQSPDQSEDSPEALPLTHLYADQLQSSKPWDLHNDSPQDFTLTFPAGVYSTGSHLPESHNTFQCLVPRGFQDQTQQALYPKPLYSYSILIFLALRHSQTGSLPVSEIYSFMTEHFPYFKTAPDGWKNSVRHNLSLNKCFEKVENRSGGMAGGGARGGASRKGCLWALNPARVEKMMEELHKWRRKDPLTVRKSMAHPEELDCLLGDWPDRRRLGPTHLPRGPPGFHRHPFLSPSTPTGPNPALRHALQSPTLGRRPSHLPQFPDPFIYHPPNRLEPPLPAHSAALLAEHYASRNTQEGLEGALGSDVDTLKPSLTHLPLHGKLWEQVRDDSLAPDSLVAVAPPSPCPTTPNPSLLDAYQGSCTPGEEKEEQTLMDLRVTATFAPSEGEASCLPASGDTDMTLL